MALMLADLHTKKKKPREKIKFKDNKWRERMRERVRGRDIKGATFMVL